MLKDTEKSYFMKTYTIELAKANQQNGKNEKRLEEVIDTMIELSEISHRK